jgi:CheY-like chemotaxis protein
VPSPIRVLVVDDHQDAADSLAMLLRFMGSDVETVYDGPAALEAIARNRAALVLLDIGMPGMDGYEVARRIRERPDGGEVTIVALTGWGQDEDRRRSQAAGFDHHLVKPISPEALQAVLGSLRRAQGQ